MLATQTPRTATRTVQDNGEKRRMQISIRQLTKENEELRAYIDVLKDTLDSRAAQLGLGPKKVY